MCAFQSPQSVDTLNIKNQPIVDTCTLSMWSAGTRQAYLCSKQVFISVTSLTHKFPIWFAERESQAGQHFMVHPKFPNGLVLFTGDYFPLRITIF